MEKDMIADGAEALLKGDLERSGWALDAVSALYPSSIPKLWQRGLYCYYGGRFEEGMTQFEADMDINGGDLEEVLWHFFCKCGKYGFQKASEDGFLPLKAANESPPPMDQVLLLFKGLVTPSDVIASATTTNATNNDGAIVHSYNGTNALAYAHFYVGLYLQLLGRYKEGGKHFQEACQFNAADYMGRLMQMHCNLFMQTTTGMKYLMPSFNIGKQHSSSRVVFGCWQLSFGHGRNELSLGEKVATALQVMDYGVTSFDCGDIYTGVEETLGKILNAHLLRGGTREGVAIHTKLVPDLSVIKQGGVTKAYVGGVMRRSLNRLGTRYLDLVQFHWWDTDYHGYIDALQYLKQLKDEGIVREIGLTNFGCGHTKEILEANIPIVTTQVQFSLLDKRPISSGLVELCLQRGVSIIAYGVLAGGFLTDKWVGTPPPFELCNRSLIKYRLIIDEFGGWEKFQRLLKTLRDIADRLSPLVAELPNGKPFEIKRVTVAMVAISYIAMQPGVGGVILGSLDANHAKESVLAVAMPLSAVDMREIELVINSDNSAVGLGGDVYEVERNRGGTHGSIMKYDLNQLNSSTHLEEICTRYLELMFSVYPVEATRSGYCHPLEFDSKSLSDYYFSPNKNNSSQQLYDLFTLRSISYDHHLDVFAKDEIESFLFQVKRMQEEVAGIDTKSLSCEQLVDKEIIVNQLQLEILKWEELKQHEKDPSLYLPFEAINYLLPTWGQSSGSISKGPSDQWAEFVQLSHPGVAHLSPPLKLVAILSRLKQLPRLLSAGKENLIRPVKVFVERAIGLCKSFTAFLQSDFEALVRKTASFVDASLEHTLLESLIEEILFVSRVASCSIASFETFMVDQLLPIATDDVSIGKECYNKILSLGQMIPDSSRLLKIGLDHFSQVKQEMEQMAAKISPGKSWQQITQDQIRPDHPAAANLLQAYMDEIHHARHHMLELELVSSQLLPDDEGVVGIYTPPSLMAFSPFGDFLNPSPFAGMASKKLSPNAHSGYLMLHPIATRGLTPEEEEELLRSHDYSWIKVIAPHECYPGHHIQALLAQNNPRPLRKYHQSAYFYEGWGLYCEQLAYETGFFKRREGGEGREKGKGRTAGVEKDNMLVRMTQLRLQLWRAARVILDVRLHRGELTLEECCEFLCSEVLFDRRSAAGEVLMYASRPTYAPCYITGLHELLEMRERERGRCQSEGTLFDLRSFHDKVLKSGSLPFPLIERLMDSNH